MPLTGRLEKHRSITLLVDAGQQWINVVLDGTGFEFQGPVTDDEDVKRICRVAIPALQALGQKSVDL